MRAWVSGFVLLVFFPLVSSAAASAADLKVKVVDPQAAAVAGAEVSLVGAGGKVLVTQTTSAEGIAVLNRRGDSALSDHGSGTGLRCGNSICFIPG